MANKTNAFGLAPVRYKNGTPYNGATIDCWVSASYATALFIGDPVLLSPTLAEKDPTATMPTINASAGTTGTLVIGVIVSFEPEDRDSTIYNPASTARIAHVCMDKNVIYQIRGDGSGAPTAVFPGQNAEMVATAAGSTVTGFSGFHLDETTPTTTQAFPLHIMNIVPATDNVLGDNVVYEVLLNTQENATGSILGVTAS